MSEANNLDWKEYESITKYIYEVLGQEFGVQIEGYGSNFKVKGKSGVQHQIDVLTSQSNGENIYRTAIECKYWKKKINKETIMKLSQIIEDAEINEGIVVSKSGFTKDALQFAKHCNIKLIQLREVEEKDKEPKAFEIGIIELLTSSSILRPEVLKIEFESEKTQEINEPYQIRVNLANGTQVTLNYFITAFQNELHRQAKVAQVITKCYEIRKGSITNKRTNTNIRINRLIFTGVLKRIDSSLNKKFSIVEPVSLIMKTIFEERTFSISEHGIIIENQKKDNYR